MVSRMVVLPMEVVDVEEMVVLDGKPAIRTCGVGEGDEIMCGSPPKLQQAHRHNEDGQRNETTYIPEVHRMPLEGEWTVCASSSIVKNSSGDTDETVERTVGCANHNS